MKKGSEKIDTIAKIDKAIKIQQKRVSWFKSDSLDALRQYEEGQVLLDKMIKKRNEWKKKTNLV